MNKFLVDRLATEERIGIIRLMICYLLLIIGSIIFIIPMLWCILTSLMTESQIFTPHAHWFPEPVQWRNYIEAIQTIPFFTYIKNSGLITILTIVGIVFSSSLVAYGFSCIDWPGRDVLFIVVLATMMLPAQVTMIPVFLLFCKLGWIDTFKPLIVPSFFANAFFIFLLRQFFKTLPNDLLDAAKIDGCSALGTYYRIVLPLSRPALVTVIIFTFNMSWNDFLSPLIYLMSEEKKTLALGLQSFTGQYSSEWGYLMAISMIMVFPVLLTFFFGQRYFIRGVVLTGLKE